MDQSQTIGALAGALTKAQRAFPNVRKTKTATIPTKSGSKYSYTYADLADVWDAIRTPLTDNGISVVQAPEMMESGLAIVTTIFHESGEWLSSILVMPTADRTPQALGSAITYLRRYGLCAMLGIVSDEDNDAQDQQDQKQPAQRPASYDPPAKSPTKAPEKAHDAPKSQKRPRTREEYIDGVRVLWRREVELGGATPGTEAATNFNTATLEEITILGRAASTRVKALEAREQPA